MDNPLVQLEPGLFIWTILVFLVLLALLRKYAWGPLLAALDERQAGIRKSLDDADRAKRELEQVETTANAIVGKARTAADAILSDARADGAKLREEIRRQAQQEAQTITENAARQIQQAQDRAVSEIRQQAVDLSLAIASKLIRRNLTRDDNDALIDDALRQIDGRQLQ